MSRLGHSLFLQPLTSRKLKPQAADHPQILCQAVAGGGEIVADNGAVGPGLEKLILVVSELVAAPGQADHRSRVDQTEEGDGAQDFGEGDRLHFGHGRAGNGGEDIDGDG